MNIKTFSRRYIEENSAALLKFMENELTGAQKSYIMKYYGEGKNIRKIAAECGVYPSTVSRTIDRAAKKLQKAIDNAQKLCG